MPKSDKLYERVTMLIDAGAPIDGVGFQGHLQDQPIDYNSFAENMQRFADLGLNIYITEFTSTLPQNFTRVVEKCLEQPACTTFNIWRPFTSSGVFNDDLTPNEKLRRLAGSTPVALSPFLTRGVAFDAVCFDILNKNR